jgi:transposase InsO family protein
MGGKKTAYDNAVTESFFSSLKNELVHHCVFPARNQARAAIFDYIKLYYNRKRLHQALGYRTPDEVEREKRVSSACPLLVFGLAYCPWIKRPAPCLSRF